MNVDKDKRFDENLKAIRRRIDRPADATEQQVRRWVNLTQAARPAGVLRRAGAWATPVVRRWALSAAAVAVIAAGLFLAFQTQPRSVSAEEIFQQVGSTLASQPVLHLTVKNVELDGRMLDFEFIGANEGRAMYAHVDARSLPGGNPLALNVTLARDGDDSWVHIRQMMWDKKEPMGHLIPQNGSLLIDVPVSSSTNEAVRQILPMAIHLQEVQALVESLRQAVPNIRMRETADGLVLLEGEISRPADLDLRMLCDTTDTARMVAGMSPTLLSGMSKQDVQKIIRNVKTSLQKSMSEEDFETVSQRLDLIGLVAIQQLQSGSADEIAESAETFGKNLRSLLTGATITITYDPDTKRLLGVNMDNVGPARGTMQLRFDEETIDRSLLRRNRFADEPNMKTMSRDEVIYGMLLPMLQPKGKESDTE